MARSRSRDDSEDLPPRRAGRGDDDSRDDLPPARRGGVPVWLVVAGVLAGGALALCVVGGVAAVLLTGRSSAPSVKTPVAVPAGPAVDMTDKPIKTIQAMNPKGPFLVRGNCQVWDFYVAEFGDSKDTHLNIKITDPDDRSSTLFCYIPRQSEDASKLLEHLGSGRQRVMTLRCRFTSRLDTVVTLDRVSSWGD